MIGVFAHVRRRVRVPRTSLWKWKRRAETLELQVSTLQSENRRLRAKIGKLRQVLEQYEGLD